MELTKEEMKLVIRCLSDIEFLNQTDKNPFVSSIDLKGLPTVITKFQTYLKGGESCVTLLTMRFLKDFMKKLLNMSSGKTSINMILLK